MAYEDRTLGSLLGAPEIERIAKDAIRGRDLSREALSIPCRLEIGPEGGHGFADGSGMCMAGWTRRAVEWYEAL